MKTPDEIKKGLECCNLPGCKGEECPYNHDEPCHFAMHEDALAYIKQLEANQPKWISVKERLPDDDVNVLVYAIGNHESSIIAMTSYTHRMHGYNIEGWRSPWQYFFHEYKITYWMPLPDAPKED